MHDVDHDVELVRRLIRSWYSVRAWAEQLLVDSLGLSEPRDLMQHRPRVGVLKGTPWHYRQHGFGVEVTQPGNKGGIDFDFDRTLDEGWLHGFLIKQYNGGQLTKRDYRPLVHDRARWTIAVARAIRMPHDDGQRNESMQGDDASRRS